MMAITAHCGTGVTGSESTRSSATAENQRVSCACFSEDSKEVATQSAVVVNPTLI